MVSPEIRPIAGLLAANTISQIGNSFSAIAIPWFVLATTGSASRTGIVVAVGVVAGIVSGILGGAVVDRIGYKPASIISDLFSGVAVMLIPLLHLTVGITFWQLVVLVFLGEMLDAPGRSARQAMFPEIVQRISIPLERANGIYQTTGRIAQVLAPPLAGVLIAVLGPANLLWVDAATFAISAAIVTIAIPPVARNVALDAGRGLRAYFREVGDGFRFLYGRRILFWMITAFAVGSLIAEPIYAVILPVYAKDVLQSPVALGMIFAALGAGSLVGNLLYVTVGMRLSRSAILLGGFAIRALAFAVMLAMPSWWVIAVAIFIGAVALEPTNPMTMSIMQEQVPAGMRGRVFGASSAINSATFPLGILVFGFMIGWLGMQATLAIFVVLNLALPVWMASRPQLRHIARPVP